jgi:hypothetical protein
MARHFDTQPYKQTFNQVAHLQDVAAGACYRVRPKQPWLWEKLVPQIGKSTFLLFILYPGYPNKHLWELAVDSLTGQMADMPLAHRGNGQPRWQSVNPANKGKDELQHTYNQG